VKPLGQCCRLSLLEHRDEKAEWKLPIHETRLSPKAAVNDTQHVRRNQLSAGRQLSGTL
jgi:hypothetical protein